MFTQAIIWIQAIKSGYTVGSKWIQWAESAMLKATTVPAWLVDLYYASTAEQALGALSVGMYDEDASEDVNRDNFGEFDRTQLYLGFLYLRYKHGDINLIHLLRLAGECTDAANYSQPSCEAFFSTLNEAEGKVAPVDDLPFAARVRELFVPFQTMAQKCLPVLGPDKSMEINK